MVAHKPLHAFGRAELLHPALASGDNVQTAQKDKGDRGVAEAISGWTYPVSVEGVGFGNWFDGFLIQCASVMLPAIFPAALPLLSEGSLHNPFIDSLSRPLCPFWAM